MLLAALSGFGGLVVSMLASGTGGLVVSMLASGTGGLLVSMLSSGTQVRGFKPSRSRRMPSFGREVKVWVPCRIFTARERSLAVFVEVGPTRPN
jgi:hypothetical protein